MKKSAAKIDTIKKGRLYFLFFTLVVFMSVLLGRVYYFKTVKGAEYETEAKNQQISRYDDVTIIPGRGSVLDRNNQAMAISTPVYNVAVDPKMMKTISDKYNENTAAGIKDLTDIKTQTIDSLSSVLGLDRAMLEDYFSTDPATGELKYPVYFKYIAKQISREKKEELEALGVTESTAVVYEKDYKRRYVLENVASDVIGFIRGDSKHGLERQYDELMSGTPGRSFRIYDNEAASTVSRDVPAVEGYNLVTTLDYNMQRLAQEVVDDAYNAYNPDNAAAIVMNPNTGEIYAMADALSFNGNEPASPQSIAGGRFAATWESMSEKEQVDYLNSAWNNFNVTSTFEPGSIFKPMFVAAALEEGIITNSKTFYCGGFKQVADRTIKCNNVNGHGRLDVEGVLAQSCNVAMMEIAELMGKETFYKYQQEFGVGQKTGIDLPSEESASTLMYDLGNIGPVELATMSFGQSFNCTPIQSIIAFSSVINGGNIMRPYIVSRVVDNDGNIIMENKPKLERKVISKETSDIVRKDMEATMLVGTGKKARIEGYSIGGKTGTGQQGDREKNLHTISFISYISVEDPEIVAMVTIHLPENYQDGVTSPAPFMKKLMEGIIKYKNIEPTESVDSSQALNVGSAQMVELESVAGMSLTEAVSRLEAAGLTYSLAGSGSVVSSQAPNGGIQVEAGSSIILYLEKGEGVLNEVKVPDVLGKTYDEAVTALSDAGFGVVFEGDNEAGSVAAQEPRGGFFAEGGSDVKLIFE